MLYPMGNLVVWLKSSRSFVQRIVLPAHRLSPEVVTRVWHIYVAKERTSTHTTSKLSLFDYCQGTLRAVVQMRYIRCRERTLDSVSVAHLQNMIFELSPVVTTNDISFLITTRSINQESFQRPFKAILVNGEINSHEPRVVTEKGCISLLAEASYIVWTIEIKEHMPKLLGGPTLCLRGNEVTQFRAEDAPLTLPIFTRRRQPQFASDSFEQLLVSMCVRRMGNIDIYSR